MYAVSSDQARTQDDTEAPVQTIGGSFDDLLAQAVPGWEGPSPEVGIAESSVGAEADSGKGLSAMALLVGVAMMAGGSGGRQSQRGSDGP